MTVLTTNELLALGFGLGFLYTTSLIVYRLYLSPLAKFPGPTLAAATLWYEYYYDVVKRGRYTWKIAELHAQYGPIVRISPHELHIDDPELVLSMDRAKPYTDRDSYYDELYVGPSTRRTLKYGWSVRGFGPLNYTFATIGHEHHRIRRGALAPFFSKTLVQQLEPSVQAMVDKLTTRLERFKGTDTIINMIDMYPCLTTDIICQYSFGAPYGYLDMPTFSPLWHRAVMEASEGSHFFKQFPWLESAMRQMPQTVVRKMAPKLASLFLLIDMVHEKVSKVQADLKAGVKIQGQRTIFHEVLTNDQLSPEEKTPERLEAEGVGLVAAGSMTVAHTLSVISYNIIANPVILAKLQAELAESQSKSSSRLKWAQLEQLPYLSAIIQEGFRWGHGVSHRLQRISPDIDLQYGDWSIPRGTPVGMTSIMMHNNLEHFPNGHEFDPERWLQPNASQLRKYLVPFSKGSRQCLGMNLAYCELYVTLAAVFAPGRFQFELFETDASDAEVGHDFFNACQRMDSKGIRVRIA